MKKEINLFRIILLAVLVVVAVIAFVTISKQTFYRNITEFTIYEMGTMSATGTKYSIKQEDGAWIASCTNTHFSKINTRQMTIDDDSVKNIKTILKENHVHRWNRFSLYTAINKLLGKPLDKLLGSIVTDGTYYGFYIELSNGRVIECKEYNAYPKNFLRVFHEIEAEING